MTTASTAPNPLLALGGHALQFALNRALQLDPDMAAELAALEGRSIELELAAPRLLARITVERGALKVGPAQVGNEPDLSLKATLGAILARVLPGAAPASPGRLKIAGDVELAQALQRLAQRYSPDIEAALSARLGEVVGVQVAKGLRAAFGSVSTGARELAEAGADYLRDERRDVLGRAELEAYLEDVDSLRDDVERTERRVLRLQRRLID
jgi:ubiquinone biosynthesis protein UbiJ